MKGEAIDGLTATWRDHAVATGRTIAAVLRALASRLKFFDALAIEQEKADA